METRGLVQLRRGKLVRRQCTTCTVLILPVHRPESYKVTDEIHVEANAEDIDLVDSHSGATMPPKHPEQICIDLQQEMQRQHNP